MRILVCGASGMIGHKVWQVLARSGHDVLGTLHGGYAEPSSWGLTANRAVEHFEAGDREALTATLDRVEPMVIVNCLGITKRKPEASDTDRMFRVNALFPHHLAHWAARRAARVIQFSTDCVFDGEDGEYSERSVVTARDLYGQTKYFGELDYEHCLTLRTSMIGRELTGRTELLEWLLAQRGKTVAGFVNARYSGLTTNEMAKIVSCLVADFPDLNGKYQVAGPRVTKYDLLCKLRDAFQLDVRVVSETGFACDRTLQAQRFQSATGITVPSWDAMIAELAADRASYDRTS